ncbi:hypothetical protein N7540_008319 [Penicillium herquei]|nr:hypothetical protein N7540_008319 [Penicillium herquei]
MAIEEDDDEWLNNDEYLGTEVTFPSNSVWKIDSKITEHEYRETEIDCNELGVRSETRGVFSCSKVTGHGPPTAIIKFRLQIPWYGKAHKSPDDRAKQAIQESPSSFKSEIEALSLLTEAGCSSTPALLGYKEEEQAYNERVPGGYKLSILMEKLPGSDPEDLWFNIQMPIDERHRLRSAFKKAWLYLVDWEYWHFEKKKGWQDYLYIMWNLAQEGPSSNIFDMSDWEL